MQRFLLFKEYHFEDEIRYIDARIPKFAYDGKSELEKSESKEISKIINEELKMLKIMQKEYYEAFIATGGDPKEYIPRGIHVDYEIKCITEKQRYHL